MYIHTKSKYSDALMSKMSRVEREKADVIFTPALIIAPYEVSIATRVTLQVQLFRGKSRISLLFDDDMNILEK